MTVPVLVITGRPPPELKLERLNGMICVPVLVGSKNGSPAGTAMFNDSGPVVVRSRS